MVVMIELVQLTLLTPVEPGREVVGSPKREQVE